MPLTAAIDLTDLSRLSPQDRDQWHSLAVSEVAELCQGMVYAGLHPGVIGDTDPTRAAAVRAVLGASAHAEPWNVRHIEAWRDRAIDTARTILTGPDTTYTPAGAATIGLVLCDVRVRDVLVLDIAQARPAARATMRHQLWPIAETVPDSLRAPVGTTLAIAEYLTGRPIDTLLAWATEATPDYRLASLIGRAAATGLPPKQWQATMSQLSEADCRRRTASLTIDEDPLAKVAAPTSATSQGLGR